MPLASCAFCKTSCQFIYGRKVGEEASKGRKEIMKADKKEGKVAMRIYWVIDKDEEPRHKFPCEEDVENEDSEE